MLMLGRKHRNCSVGDVSVTLVCISVDCVYHISCTPKPSNGSSDFCALGLCIMFLLGKNSVEWNFFSLILTVYLLSHMKAKARKRVKNTFYVPHLTILFMH